MPHRVVQRVYVVHKAHARNQRDSRKEPRITNFVDRRAYLQLQYEDYTASTQHYSTMRRPIIRLVDDVTLVRNAEIQKLQNK